MSARILVVVGGMVGLLALGACSWGIEGRALEGFRCQSDAECGTGLVCAGVAGAEVCAVAVAEGDAGPLRDAGGCPDDRDCDGVITAADCDDDDPSLRARAEDQDCDGVLTADDCDDSMATSTIRVTDKDCDGVWDDIDCNDEDINAPLNDQDCDGVLTADDCDDTDENSTTRAEDDDCDGVVTDEDCDDTNAALGAREADADCDGVLTGNDCDDTKPALGARATDEDCDGVPTADDCDDADENSTTRATDGDCDGVPTADDCNDGDEKSTVRPTDWDCDGVVNDNDCNLEDVNSLENLRGTCFRRIPAGEFTMGSPMTEQGRQGNEAEHSVRFTYSFAMGETEVTQGQWKALAGDENPSHFGNCNAGSSDDCPVEQVDWFAALAYANAVSRFAGLQECYTLTPMGCNQPSEWGDGESFCEGATFLGLDCTGYRLPTEAEWEYAYRAETTTPYHSGASTLVGCGAEPNLESIGWYCGNASDITHGWKQKEANNWGLYDIAGNVSEWVWDRFNENYPEEVTDHSGPLFGEKRVIRGGSWADTAEQARAAYRDSNTPGTRSNRTGFRLTRTLPPLPSLP